MSEFPKVKKGDRVRVVVEGEVTCANELAFNVGSGYINYRDAASIEVLAPPVKVGDILTGYAELGGLPDGSVVKGVDPDFAAAEKQPGGWYFANPNSKGHKDIEHHLPVRVLYLPEDAA